MLLLAGGGRPHLGLYGPRVGDDCHQGLGPTLGVQQAQYAGIEQFTPWRDRATYACSSVGQGRKAMATITITRKSLYDQVWSEPILHLAKRYGMSNVGLAKICRKHNIPRPPCGY